MPSHLANANFARLAVAYLLTSALTAHPRNPRTHSKRQIGQLARSIETFGFNVPILVNSAGEVIAGHGRLLAARQLGRTEVPTICLDHLTEVQARAFMLADNRLAEIATWDDQLLGETLRDLAASNLDFNLEVTGFDLPEIDLRIEALTAPAKPDRADALPAPGPAVTQPGDLWLLGRHRLLCGSALDPASYTTLLGGERAEMVFTDPPYNVPIQGHVSGLGKIRHREFAMAVGEMSSAEFTGFLRQVCEQLVANSVDGSLHYICMDWRHVAELFQAGQDVFTEQKNLCVWVKDQPGMGSLYRSQHELVAVFKNGTAAHRNNVQLGRYGRNRSNVWNYPGIQTMRRRSEEGDLLALHPTVKPVALVADAIMDASTRGGLVLDPFLGSGTTLMAAERLGRRGCGLELDGLYCDTIIRRWQAYTGDSARHAVSGRSFDEITAERIATATYMQEADHGA